MVEYLQSPLAQGLQVIVGRAGGAVYLPGMGTVATMMALPIIGVPAKGNSLGCRFAEYITLLC